MNHLKLSVLLITLFSYVLSNPLDLSTFSNLDKVRQTHIELNLSIDFSNKM